MAERYEVVIDFARYKTGAKIELRNLGVPNSVDYDNTGKVMQFEVVGDAVPKGLPAEVTLPTGGLYSLNPNKDVWELKDTAIQGTTRIQVVRSGGQWVIQSSTAPASTAVARSGSDDGGSGKDGSGGGGTKTLSWQNVVLSNYRDVVANPASGDVQVWEITNKSGGWFHPVHIHLVDFKILDRNGRAPYPYEMGPKDVVYVGENETIRAIMRFGTKGDPSTDGRYMIHCHNLPHEDHDMMTQFRVGKDVDRDWTHGPDDPANANCNDPINADPAAATKA
jgi:FtsP/CotA-like multicopper oxidase with cupredoxin domain